MENKYEVISEENINEKTTLYTIIDNNTRDDYSCIIETFENGKIKILVDDLANIYDVGEALFQHDLDLFPILPKYMITKEMEREYDNYYPGKAKSIFKTDNDFYKAYYTEEERIKQLRGNVKKLVK